MMTSRTLSTPVYVAASIGCAFAPDLGWLLVGRALQGLSAGGREPSHVAATISLVAGGVTYYLLLALFPALAALISPRDSGRSVRRCPTPAWS